MWSSQNNSGLYLMNADGTGLVEKQLNGQILGDATILARWSALFFMVRITIPRACLK